MKITSQKQDAGSVLMTSMFTITVMTLICATSLYVASQNATTGMQTASWQVALTGAEAGVDRAIAALNTGTWTNWRTVSTSTLPTSEPSSTIGATATVVPTTSQYNFLHDGQLQITNTTTTSEGISTLSAWVTVDTANMSSSNDTNGKQWYRIRSTGQVGISGPKRVSANKLDNILRNTIGMNFNRKGGSVVGATRTIEVIMQPLSTNGWARAVTLKNWLSMSGGAFIDSFDSGSSFKSSTINGIFGQYDITKRQTHGDVGINNTGGTADLKSTYVYGNVAYSGVPPKNATNAQSLSTPFSASVPAQSAPTWSTFTTVSAGNPGTLAAGNKNTPTYYKVTGDLTVPGGGTLNLTKNDNSVDNQVYIWVTGKLTTSGSGEIKQDSNVNVTWYVGGDITVSGDSYTNKSGVASSVTIIGYGSNNKATISGSGNFIGTLNAPAYDVTISGSGAFMGAIIADTLTISGSGGFHYDEALSSGASSTTVGNYAFASWFEDNSDASHNQTVTDNLQVSHPAVSQPIVY